MKKEKSEIVLKDNQQNNIANLEETTGLIRPDMDVVNIMNIINHLSELMLNTTPGRLIEEITSLSLEMIRSIWMGLDEMENITWQMRAIVAKGLYTKHLRLAQQKGIQLTVKDIMNELTAELKLGRTQIYQLLRAAELFELKPELMKMEISFNTVTYALRYAKSMEEAVGFIDKAIAYGYTATELKKEIEYKKSKRSKEYYFKLVPADKGDIDVSDFLFSASAKIYKSADGIYVMFKIADSSVKSELDSVISEPTKSKRK